MSGPRRQTVPVPSDIPCPQRWFDDYEAGERFTFGSTTIDEAEIIEFGRKFDPQPFHIDPEAARHTVYGRLIASGWHTGSIMMRLLGEHLLGPSSMGSPGLDELRWLAPVHPGDRLTLVVDVLELRPSRSKPDRGIVKMAHELVNQHGATVVRSVANMMIARRPRG
ncbi:MAG: MaoC family dehydratase [Acidimicrobiales bacterium]|nr:MaoC family dehydratase [Acidimicrobiales bacterium]MYG60497.1 MaoC family dehydratase [Acidimicrobiales bacterium]MYJ47594.1 MaoC family dehydratase [Acidimicrobiales bacterium]